MEIFEFHEFALHYQIFGDGSRLVLAFHGFGQHPSVWEHFQPIIPPNTRVISVALFGHHTSAFPAERVRRSPLRKEEWSDLIRSFIAEQGADSVEIWAYSMGCRMAMCFAEERPDLVQRMILFAPDGLKRNILYRFACETMLGRWIFRQALNRIGFLNQTILVLVKVGWMKERLGTFLLQQLDADERREKIYESWLIHRRMFPGKKLRAFQGKGIICFGKHDDVIPPRLSKRARILFSSQTHIVEAPFGHRMMTDAFTKWLGEQSWWV
jgi:pimeloyl-ACP methyl ester carboxylesterase